VSDSILLSVTREDIDNGEAVNNCAIDLALRRHFNAKNSFTGFTCCTIFCENSKQSFNFVDKKVAGWISRFDNAVQYGDRNLIEPITVELIPAFQYRET
jgi:hypothetical protein